MKLLEELHAQRKLIRQHLAWLDQKIARLEQDQQKYRPVAKDDAPQAEQPAGTDSQKPAASSQTQQQPKETAVEPLTKYKSLVGDEIQRAKIGCLVLFVLSTALFLFLLFGLPYLIN